jgi:hypothetical protein
MTDRAPGSRHGLRALKARVKVRGLGAIDRRTDAARSLLTWRVELLQDLGGESSVSAPQMALVEAAVRTRLYVDHLDAWLMEQRSLVNAKRRSVHPVLRERQQLVDSLARLLSLLGLERRSPKAVDLAAYLRERYGPDPWPSLAIPGPPGPEAPAEAGFPADAETGSRRASPSRLSPPSPARPAGAMTPRDHSDGPAPDLEAPA